jgi:nitroreductase
MNVLDAIETRQSVRAYEPRTIEVEKFEAILNAIRQAPSAGNLQAFQVYVIRHAETKKRLAQAALGQDFLARAPVVLAFCACPRRSGKYGRRGAELYCVQDATIAAAYAQLAATGVGLASCWIGAFDDSEVTAVLGLPAGERPVAVLPVGYAAETPTRTARRPLPDLVQDRD